MQGVRTRGGVHAVIGEPKRVPAGAELKQGGRFSGSWLRLCAGMSRAGAQRAEEQNQRHKQRRETFRHFIFSWFLAAGSETQARKIRRYCFLLIVVHPREMQGMAWVYGWF
jgi:hypothetical protein